MDCYTYLHSLGATNFGVVVASNVEVIKSSAIPTLNFAIVLAVAGATIIASAQSPNDTC